MTTIDAAVRQVVRLSAAWHAELSAKVPRRMPWDFSEEPLPGADHPNVPTPLGRKLGRQVARLADIEEAEQLKQFPNMKARCHDCAARAGTAPNGCPETLMDLIKCAAEGVPFYCHVGVKEGEAPRRLCVGFVVLQGASIR